MNDEKRNRKNNNVKKGRFFTLKANERKKSFNIAEKYINNNRKN